MKLLRFLVFALGVAGAIGPAHAAFVDLDLIAAGDKLVTRDTGTQLEWLDINAAAGFTVNSVMQGAGGWLDLGFRPATRAELEQLFLNANVAIGPPRAGVNTPGVLELITHLGCNLCYLGSTLNGGSVLFYEPDLDRQGLLGHAVFNIDIYGEGFATAASTWEKSWDLGSTNLTPILVRGGVQGVAEPPIFGLLGLAMLALAFRARSRRI